MAQYNFKFDVFDMVIIKALDVPGRVVAIKVVGHNIFYSIEYWWKGTIQSVALYEDELSKVKS
ncbi:MAG: hypothetical protein ACTSPD_10050 [Promethearchaeota archaeon]